MEERTRERPLAGFNLVAVAGTEGLCLHFDGTLRAVPFGAGAHVISSDGDLDDPSLPEKQRFDRLLAAGPGLPGIAGIRGFLSSHETPRPVCKHGDAFGTVSSTLLLRTDRGDLLHHVQGAPCSAPFPEPIRFNVP